MVGKSQTPDIQQQPQKTDESGLPWWALLLMGLAAVAAGIGGGILVMNQSRKKG